MKQRKQVRVRDLLIYFWLQLFLLVIIWTLFGLTVGLDWLPIPWWATLLIVMALSYAPLRFLAIGCVLMYKAYSPVSGSGVCRFTPTCSTYMIIAINKYGLVVGIIKGIRRLLRCKPPNGGEDWP